MAALTGRRARNALARGLRNPVGLARGIWSRGVMTLLPAAMLVPERVRRPAARPLAAMLERASTRNPRSGVAPQLAFIARWAAGPPDAAADLAVRVGTSTHATPRARRQLALMARAAGLRAAAARIVATIPEDRSADLEDLRSRVAYDRGDFTGALAHAQAALAGGARRAKEIEDLSAGHLAIMRPGWLPDLGPEVARLDRVRGKAVPGRVVHLVATSLPYRLVGYTVRTQSVAEAQRAAGLDPHVVTRAGFPQSEGAKDAGQRDDVGGIPHHRLAPGFTDVKRLDRALTETARAAAVLLEGLRPAVLQPASNHEQARVALALARPLGIPVVYEVRGFWEETWLSLPSHDEETAMDAERYRLTREAETSVMLAADAVVTLAETMRQEIIARGCAPDRVVVVPNAVDVERFRPRPRDDALAASLGIGRDEPILGYVSTFSPYEGIPYLLEAASILRSQGTRLRVLLVGDGVEWDTILEVAHRLGLDDGTLVMPGRVPHEQILAWYSLIDVFVVPRTANRVSQLVTPLKPYEAMALERATVVSDVAALREIVTPGETGLTFRPEDPQDLARVLGRLLDDPSLRLRLGRQAREWIVADRTWAANGRRYRELFERLGAA